MQSSTTLLGRPDACRDEASLPAFSPNGDGRLDTDSLSFTLLNPAQVRVRVFRGSKLVATLLDGALGAGPQQLAWDGSSLRRRRYTVSVAATDSLLTVTQTVLVRRRPQGAAVAARLAPDR